ncbi:hypothetical protein IC582_021307 [Cucumis melo]
MKADRTRRRAGAESSFWEAILLSSGEIPSIGDFFAATTTQPPEPHLNGGSGIVFL